MKRLFPSLAILSVLAACGTAPAVHGQAVQEYTPQVFVYSGLVLDMGREQEGFAGRPRTLADCSNGEFLCVSGGNIFQLVTPRECSKLASGPFTVGGVVTEVLGREVGAAADMKLPHHAPRSPVWLLGSAGRPHTVYVYSRVGLVGLYHDPSSQVDLVTIAKDRGLDGLRNADRREDGYYFRLTTFDGYGTCTGPLPAETPSN